MANVFPIGVWVLRDFPDFPRLQRMSAMAERFENPNPSGQVVQLRNEVQQRSQERGVPLVGESEDSHCLLQPCFSLTLAIQCTYPCLWLCQCNSNTMRRHICACRQCFRLFLLPPRWGGRFVPSGTQPAWETQIFFFVCARHQGVSSMCVLLLCLATHACVESVLAFCVLFLQ